ncbi:MAG: chloride channel protein [Bdellovibrionota bacterium]
MNPLNLILALILGVAAAAISYGFQAVIDFSEELRHQYPQIILGLPILFILTVLLKKKTLYFPYKVKDMNEMVEPKNFFWNRWKAFYHFVGASLSHLFGASVGREGVVVLATTGVARLFNLSLPYWGPVAASVGFAAITGNKWVGVIFLIEMYTTQFSQKIWTFFGAWVAVLLLQTIKFPHLLSAVMIPETHSWFNRFVFIFLLGLVIGYISRSYKKSYFFLSDFFAQKNILWPIVMSLAIGYALYNPVMRPLQSLSLDLVSKFSSGSLMLENDMQLLFFKLIFTLFCVSLGFFGGEFVPLVLVGCGLGATGAQYFGESLLLGSTLGAFAIFAGVTRLKWTCMVLCASLMDYSMLFWVYIFFSVVHSFSGDKSIYLEPRRGPKIGFMNFKFGAFPGSGPRGPM